MTKSKVIYSTASAEDLKSVVTLHTKTFDKNFTTALGSKFLHRYYQIFLNETFFFLVAKKDNKVIGFIVGADDYTIIAKYIKRNIHLFLFPIISSISNIKLIPHVLKKVLNFILNNRVNSLPKELTHYNEITSFAVSNNWRGSGIGGELLTLYLSKACSGKTSGIFITTDAENNIPTINFYQKHDFKIVHSYQQSAERKMHVMSRTLKSVALDNQSASINANIMK